MRYITNSEVVAEAERLAMQLGGLTDPSLRKIYGVPRGGIPAAYMVMAHLENSVIVDDPTRADLFVDDLIDSGATALRYVERYSKPFFALFRKADLDNEWLVFPWDKSEESSASDICTRLLQYIGEDVTRGGLKETPTRFIKAWQHYSSGYAQDATKLLKCFADGAEHYSEMVLVKDIPVYSHCEHHLAPFFGTAHVAYIPDGKIVGLSKISRVVDVFSRRLQVQERLTNQIADAINDALVPKGVGVVIECRHLCMEARGIQRQGSSTITSALRGALLENAAARAEFLGFLK